MLDQICKSCQCRVVDHIIVNDLENTIDLVDPVHNRKARIINGDQVSHKSLEKMMMGVDKTRIHEFPLSIDDLRIPCLQVLSDSHDLRPLHQDITVLVYPVLPVTGNDRFCISDQYLRCHTIPPDSGRVSCLVFYNHILYPLQVQDE